MTEIGPQQAPDYLAELDKLTGLIDEGRKLVDDGNMIDLSSFETMVTVICGRMAEYPPDNPDEVKVAIENLVVKLTGLSEAMKSHLDDKN